MDIIILADFGKHGIGVYGYGYHDSGPDIAKGLASQTGRNPASSSFQDVPGNNSNSNNSSGFNALPAGACSNGIFHQTGDIAAWHTTMLVPEATNRMISRIVYNKFNNPGRSLSYKLAGIGVRCVKD